METAPRWHDVRIYSGPETTCVALAEAVAELVNGCQAACPRLTVALSGGESPRRLYQILAQAYRDRLPWHKLHFFWGDDRFVPREDPRSNYKLAQEALLSQVPVPPAHVHPMPTFFKDAGQAAAEYEATLKEYFSPPWPRLDLILLGLGPEGHTASLYPHSPALTRQDRWVMAVEALADPPLRLTLTLPVLNNAAQVWFLVTGEEKREALARALGPGTDPQDCPAAAVRPWDGELVWWVDEAAVGLAAAQGLL
jgi:6-phosphogluconolactonase